MYGAYTFGDQRPQHSSGVLPQTFPKKMKRIAKGIIFDMDGAEKSSLQVGTSQQCCVLGIATEHMSFRSYSLHRRGRTVRLADQEPYL